MSTRIRRAITASAAAASMALLLLTTGTPAAAGDTIWHGCDPGNVCLYNGDLTPDYLSYETPGYVPDGEWFWVVANNGQPQEGADHVYFEYRYYGTRTWYPECLHHLPGNGSVLDLRDGAVAAQIRHMDWGGECPS